MSEQIQISFQGGGCEEINVDFIEINYINPKSNTMTTEFKIL